VSVSGIDDTTPPSAYTQNMTCSVDTQRTRAVRISAAQCPHNSCYWRNASVSWGTWRHASAVHEAPTEPQTLRSWIRFPLWAMSVVCLAMDRSPSKGSCTMSKPVFSKWCPAEPQGSYNTKIWSIANMCGKCFWKGWYV
jgi:hypothetical protein